MENSDIKSALESIAKRICRYGQIIFTIVVLLVSALPAFAGPNILYTDVISGPNSGGENNNGAYLSIFGHDFGNAGGLGTATKVLINDVEVADYKYMGNAKAQYSPNKTVQQISVQVGSLNNPTPGTALPIKVTVNGISSDTDHTFTVQPGDILYVDPVNGNDATAVKNDITKPWKHIQTNTGVKSGALTDVDPGDTIVIRGTGTYSFLGVTDTILKFGIPLTGSDPNGSANHGYIAFIGYPGETVHIQVPLSSGGGIHGTSSAFEAYGNYIVVSNLEIEGGNDTVYDGPINMQSGSNYWRVVNNRCYDWDAKDADPGEARAAGIAGECTNTKILGNHIHGIGGGTKNHGIYLDYDTSHVEIAYNQIHDHTGGNLIQFHGLSFSFMDVHHNRLYDGNRYGIAFGSGLNDEINVRNNIIYDTDFAGFYNNSSGVGGEIVHNTFYNVNRIAGVGPTGKGGISNAAVGTGNGFNFKHNIVWLSANSDGPYINTYAPLGNHKIERNLWYGKNVGVVTNDDDPVGGADLNNPLFSDASASEFSLRSNSPAIDTAGTSTISNDFLFVDRPQGSGYDVGAHEYMVEAPQNLRIKSID